MFEGILNFFKGLRKTESKNASSKDTAKERLHLVLMQDRANVSADFLELMKQEIIDVIKKYIEVDESAIDVRLTNKNGEDGENGAPALYANIPILNIRNDIKKINPSTGKPDDEEEKQETSEENSQDKKVEEKKTEEENEENTEKNSEITNNETNNDNNKTNEEVEENKEEENS